MSSETVVVRRAVEGPTGSPTREDVDVRYLLLICAPSDAAVPDTMAQDTRDWVEEMDARGVRTLGQELAPVSDATTVRVRQDEVHLFDGPFAETRELIAGFDLIEAPDLDAALDVAARHPVAAWGSVEVRPYRQP